jgi:L-threonylcarbamoyladenylate synthase
MKILKLDDKKLKETVKIAAEFIKEGKVIVCPTDTVYGLIADATNKKAVEKIFKIKKRNFQKSISLFVKSLEMAEKFAKINKTQDKFLKKVWPGQTIAVLKARGRLPKGIVSQKGKIGLRIPSYKVISYLLSVINSPLAQTSANISGKLPAGEIKEVLKQFQGRKYLPDLILDGGKLKSKKPSQVVDLTGKKLKILRV